MRLLPFFLICLLPFIVLAETVRFGTQEFAPYHYEVDEKIAGPLPELINAVCKKLQWECVHQSGTWAKIQAKAKSRQYDALYVLGKNTKREEWLDFSLPIVDALYGIFTHQTNMMTYEQPAQLAGLKVAVYGPSNTSRSLEKLMADARGMQIIIVGDDETAFKLLSQKEVDAVFSNLYVGEAIIRKLNLQNLRYAGNSHIVSYHVAFVKNRQSAKLRDRFNQAYRELYRSQKVHEILGTYFLKPSTLIHFNPTK